MVDHKNPWIAAMLRIGPQWDFDKPTLAPLFQLVANFILIGIGLGTPGKSLIKAPDRSAQFRSLVEQSSDSHHLKILAPKENGDPNGPMLAVFTAKGKRVDSGFQRRILVVLASRNLKPLIRVFKLRKPAVLKGAVPIAVTTLAGPVSIVYKPVVEVQLQLRRICVARLDDGIANRISLP
jgi:hypothetical protein